MAAIVAGNPRRATADHGGMPAEPSLLSEAVATRGFLPTALFEQFPPSYRQCLFQPVQNVDAGVGGSTFDALDIAPVDANHLRETLLRHPLPLSQTVDVPSQALSRKLLQEASLAVTEKFESGLIVAFYACLFFVHYIPP